MELTFKNTTLEQLAPYTPCGEDSAEHQAVSVSLRLHLVATLFFFVVEMPACTKIMVTV